MVAGRFVLRDRRIVTVDEAAVLARRRDGRRAALGADARPSEAAHIDPGGKGLPWLYPLGAEASRGARSNVEQA